MATIKSFTDIVQSKKLAKILPIESADMYYLYDIPYAIPYKNRIGEVKPCWSLAALLDVVSQEVSLNSFKDGNWNAMVRHDDKMIYGDKDNPIDACYEMILKLHERKIL